MAAAAMLLGSAPRLASPAHAAAAGMLLATAACANVADLGPHRTLEPAAARMASPADVLLVVDAETTSGSCADEPPGLAFTLGDAALGDCDWSDAPLSGNESIRLGYQQGVGCDPCWDHTESNLWFEATASLSADSRAFGLDVAQFLLPPSSDKIYAGGWLLWDYDILYLECPTDPNDDAPVEAATAIDPQVAHVLTLHYDFRAHRGEVWVRDVGPDGRASGVRGTPTISANCPPDVPGATGWAANAEAKAYAQEGYALLDDVRVARSAEALELAAENPEGP